MDASTVGDLFARDRRSERPALVDGTGREYDYHWLCTSAWKAGNFLRHGGVRRGVTVGVVGDGPLALLGFFGTALLGGTTRFDPPADLSAVDDLRAIVAPVDELSRFGSRPGVKRVGYGAKPDEPDVMHFDAGLWSENPSFPPIDVDRAEPLLEDGERSYARSDVFEAARGVAEQLELEPGDRVAIRAPLSDPGTVAAGILAPLLAEAAIVLPGKGSVRADVAVSNADGAPEPRRIAPASVDVD